MSRDQFLSFKTAKTSKKIILLMSVMSNIYLFQLTKKSTYHYPKTPETLKLGNKKKGDRLNTECNSNNTLFEGTQHRTEI